MRGLRHGPNQAPVVNVVAGVQVVAQRLSGSHDERLTGAR